MKRVDQGIKYLSGGLGPEEAREWEEEVKRNADLREEFEDLTRVYELVKDQLQEQDESLFRSRLQEAMRASDEGKVRERSSGRQFSFRRRLLPLSAVAGLGLF